MKPVWIILGVIGAVALALIVNHDAGTTLGLPNDSFAQLAWYAIWIAVVGAAILPGRGHWRETGRSLLLWLSIFLVITAFAG